MTALAPTFPELRRAFECVMLHARECSVHGDMDRDASIAMANLATAADLPRGLACRVVDASDRAASSMEDVAQLLGIIGDDLNRHFTRPPPTPRELEMVEMDERSERTREEMR
jgi:hypothetical protein